MKEPNLSLYACCILVKGARRSAICDLQKQKVDFIPNTLYEILIHDDIFTIKNIKNDFEKKYHNTIDEYFEFLFKNDYIFTRDEDELECFPKIDLSWKRPEIITNAIIDIDINENTVSTLNFKNISIQLDELGCKALQFRFWAFAELQDIDTILAFFTESRLKHIDIILPYSDYYEDNISAFDKMCQINQRIQFITFYKSPFACIKNIDSIEKAAFIYTTGNYSSHLACGNVIRDDFFSNMYLFTEAQKHNTCLNRKISIDTEGYIRNCPSMPEHYGNIKDMTLQEAMKHPDFKKYWFINKDQIEVCKDCEFRYICTDCRAYREDPENLLSKPLKCGYNPYTCEWEEWSTNPLKQKAIDYYGMREMVSKT